MTKLIFINYRRCDSKDAAFWLVEKLRLLIDAEVFIDEQGIEAGDNWEEHLDDKLKSADLFIAVIGPNWLKAENEYNSRRIDNADDWVRKEIEFAINKDKNTSNNIYIIPVLVSGAELPLPKALPESLKALVEYQSYSLRPSFFENDVNLLVEQLEKKGFKRKNKESKEVVVPKSNLPKNIPFQAPPLPPYYIDRPEVTQELKTRLLCNSSNNRRLVLSAIHGLGGIGKTVLVITLAHDEEVKNFFADGVLWKTLGKEPNLLDSLSNWIQQLGDHDFKPTTVDAASSHLRTLLSDKAVLIVVDDAWDEKHIEPFLVGGSKCQLIITTRKRNIAVNVNAELYNLNLMTEEQSLALFAKILGRKLEEKETQEARLIAKVVGYLPYALDLVAKRIKSGNSWEELRGYLEAEVARLEELDDAGKRLTGEISLEVLFNRSLEDLQKYQRKLKENFSWLGVLPEDVNIAAPMVKTLWEVDAKQAKDRLELLGDQSLLLPGSPVIIGEKKWNTYRVHDILHEIACRRLVQNPGQEEEVSLAEAHATFLQRYRAKTQDGKWHNLEYDGYIHTYLIWHLEKAGWIHEIHKLLCEENEEGLNGWYEACDRLGQTANFLTDVARAWKLSEDDKEVKANIAQVIGLQCRYALITTSLNSMAANLPVKLLIALLKEGLWTPEQALAYALQNSDSKKKAESLTNLADYLPSNLKQQALEKALAAAKQIESEYDRVEALTSLGDKLPPELLTEAVAAVRQIHDDYYCAKALSDLADKQPELLTEAVAAARQIQNEYDRANFLSDLADKQPELLTEAVAAARQIQNNYNRANFLSDLADKQPELLTEAVAAARQIQDEFLHAKALTSLVDKQPELLTEAVTAARQIQSEFVVAITLSQEYDRADVLLCLADKQPELLTEALAAAKQILNEHNRVLALSRLADKHPELLTEALAAARQMWDEHERADALIRLTDKHPELLTEAVATARQIQYDASRAEALRSLVDKQPELLTEALAATRQIQDDDPTNLLSRPNALNFLADKLPPELLTEALAAARQILDERHRYETLSDLANKLPPELLTEALTTVKEIQNEYYCAKALSDLANKLPPELLTEAVVAARQILDNYNRAIALTSLADKQPKLLTEAVAAAKQIQSNFDRAIALRSLTDKQPELLTEALATAKQIQDGNRFHQINALAKKHPELLSEAIAAAKEIPEDFFRALELTSLAKKKPDLLSEVVVIARQIQNNYNRADVLSRLADKQPELLTEALAAARQIESDINRGNVLKSLADKMSPELLTEELAATREIQNESDRAYVLGSLGKLPPELLTKALAIAKEIQDESSRARALAHVIRSLTDKQPELLTEALAAAREIQDESKRAYPLSFLAYKQPELLNEALAAIRQIQPEYYRAYPLSSLAYKHPELLTEYLAAVRQIPSKHDRPKELTPLAVKLSQMQKTQLFDLWRDTLHVSSLRTRPNLLVDIKALTPVIFTLGGEQAVNNIVSAIKDVSRWWR